MIDEMNSHLVVSTANATEPCTVSRQAVKISGYKSKIKKQLILISENFVSEERFANY